MLAPWAVEEMQSADLNDKRLNRRLEELLSALGERPTASRPPFGRCPGGMRRVCRHACRVSIFR
jgi:hypothetical protein